MLVPKGSALAVVKLVPSKAKRNRLKPINLFTFLPCKLFVKTVTQQVVKVGALLSLLPKWNDLGFDP